MNTALLILQVLLSATLISLILLQSSKGGLGSGLGGSGELYRTRRGAEKLVFTVTIVIAVLFLITSLVNVAVF